MLKFNVRNQSISRIDNFRPAEKSIKYLLAQFDFKTEDWKETVKTAVFRNTKTGKPYDAILDGNMCVVPWEVLSESGVFEVSVYGIKEDGSRITTDIDVVNLNSTIYGGSATQDPSPTVYETLVLGIDKLENKVGELEDKFENFEPSQPSEPGGNIKVDSELSSESTNPVQNRVVAQKFGELDKDIEELSRKVEEGNVTSEKITTALGYTPANQEDVGRLSKEIDGVRSGLSIFKYVDNYDLFSFIKRIYCPNIIGQIGICTCVRDDEREEIRVNIYYVDDEGHYIDPQTVETFNIPFGSSGVAVFSGKIKASVAVIDCDLLFANVSGLVYYNSILNEWVKYYRYLPQETADKALDKAQEAILSITDVNKKVDDISSVMSKKDIINSTSQVVEVADGTTFWRGFRTRIANLLPISSLDIYLDLSTVSVITVSLLDLSFNVIASVTRELPSGDDIYTFDFGGNKVINGDEIFVEVKSNTKSITNKSVVTETTNYVTADNRTEDKGNYFSVDSGDDVGWARISNALNATSFSLLFTTYTTLCETGVPSYDGDIIYPKEVYTVQDVEKLTESMPQTLYLDHMLKLQKHEDLMFEKTKSDKYYICSNVLDLQSTNVIETNHAISLDGFKGERKVTVKQVSTKSNVASDKPIRLLQIGDSVGGGYGGDANRVEYFGANPITYYAVAQKLFDLDAIKVGNPNLYKMQTIGFRNHFTYSIVRDGVTHDVKNAYGEGRGGWKLYDYLYNSIQGETGPDREPTSSKPINPFYDGSKIWTGAYADDLNSSGVKFSLKHYLTTYRTHDDNGNELEVGNGTGTNIHASGTNNTNTGYIVKGHAMINTPTHILQENAFNDEGIDEFVHNTELFIKAVRNEYPNIIIGIVFNDAAFGYFPEYYSGYSMDGFMNGFSNTLHIKQFDRYAKIKTMIDSFNDSKLFLIPTMFIQPTLNGCHTIEAVNADGSIVKYVGTSGTYHPNNVAHSAWGSQLYAWLKYTQTLS